jgi:hypothetical protein
MNLSLDMFIEHDVYQFIVKHLSIIDILNMCCVSRSFYNNNINIRRNIEDFFYNRISYDMQMYYNENNKNFINIIREIYSLRYIHFSVQLSGVMRCNSNYSNMPTLYTLPYNCIPRIKDDKIILGCPRLGKYNPFYYFKKGAYIVATLTASLVFLNSKISNVNVLKFHINGKYIDNSKKTQNISKQSIKTSIGIIYIDIFNLYDEHKLYGLNILCDELYFKQYILNKLLKSHII